MLSPPIPEQAGDEEDDEGRRQASIVAAAVHSEEPLDTVLRRIRAESRIAASAVRHARTTAQTKIKQWSEAETSERNELIPEASMSRPIACRPPIDMSIVKWIIQLGKWQCKC
jgi:hypothetical protein